MREREKVRPQRTSPSAPAGLDARRVLEAQREHERPPAGREEVSFHDRQLLEACQRALIADPGLACCVIWPGGHQDPARRQVLGTEGLEGRISVEVKSGVIFLEGEVPSLSHKRLAGVLARRSTTCRGVVNHLAVVLPCEDNDEERATAVRLALCRDQDLDHRTIGVHVRGPVVILEGTVRSPMMALAAESDAASVFGVERVENRLSVEPPILGKA